MKKIFYFFIFSITFYILNGQEPLLKLYLNNDEVKTYNILDINNICFIKTNCNFLMLIYSKDIILGKFNTRNIDLIKFEEINNILTNLLISYNGEPDVSFSIISIDSIIFTIIPPPEILGISPTSAKTGDIITITGSNFGDIRGDSKVTFTGADANEYISWSDAEIQVKVPDGAKSGKLYVTVNSVKSNEVNINITAPPKIININPKAFTIGDVISIYGTGFGSTKGSSIVKFNNITATVYNSWSETEIRVTVPANTTSGKLTVTVKSMISNEFDYQIVNPPEITSLVPNSFAVGEEVVITGKNFENSQNNSRVTFNNIDAEEFTSWSNTQIICKVPPGTESGDLTVTVNDITSNAVPFTIKVPIEMVLIKAGTFRMGNTGSIPEVILPEQPVHEVTISRDFYMSKYEVTQELYQSVMGTNPSNNKAGSNYPVERISWYMACQFCNKLSERDGYTPCYTINGNNVTCNWNANGYRLPTEAEWEYACKAGSTTDYYNGSTEQKLATIAWYSGNSDGTTHPVGQKEPNKWGLYDMLGNCYEHVWDWSGSYSPANQTDPKGPSSGTQKILRGGSWHSPYNHCRSSMRGWEDQPTIQSSTDGIRVVRVDN